MVLVDAADDLLGVPGGADFASGIAGVEQTQQFGAAPVVEAFVGLGQKPPAPIERVVLVAKMAEGLVRHPSAALVERTSLELASVTR